MRKNSLCLLFFLLIFSCGSKDFDTVEEAVNYVNDERHGYKYSKEINGVFYEVVYRPTDFLVNQELNGSTDKKQINNLRQKYHPYMYFNLRMSLNNKELLSNVAGQEEKFSEMVNKLAFGMEKKINIYTPKKDTLPMSDFVYPRMYGMSNSTSIMVVFPRDEKYLDDKYLNFAVQDLGLYTGEVKFKIKTSAIYNEPQLRFN